MNGNVLLAELREFDEPHEFEPSAWSQSGLKRVFDFVCAFCLIFLFCPLLLLVAVAIKLSSSGPVFFRQVRFGKDQKRFRIFKFRTMLHQTECPGSHVTLALDPRVTAVGRFLRKWKLDEVPQLFNVLAGDMSFVGPRPRVPEQVHDYPVLVLRPGVTGMATLHFRHEELLFRNLQPQEVERMYRDEIFPVKVQLDRDYFSRATFASDLSLMVQTVISVSSEEPQPSAAKHYETIRLSLAPALSEETAYAEPDGD